MATVPRTWITCGPPIAHGWKTPSPPPAPWRGNRPSPPPTGLKPAGAETITAGDRSIDLDAYFGQLRGAMRKRSTDSAKIRPSHITPYDRYLSRRALLAGGLGVAAVQSIGGFGRAAFAQPAGALSYVRNAALSVTDAPNAYRDISTYNNYYEFGTDKSDPSENAQKFRTQPWNVTVGGEAEVTGTFSLEDILKPHPFEERVYRLPPPEPCPISFPLSGSPLATLLKRFKPTSKAKFVEF